MKRATPLALLLVVTFPRFGRRADGLCARAKDMEAVKILELPRGLSGYYTTAPGTTLVPTRYLSFYEYRGNIRLSAIWPEVGIGGVTEMTAPVGPAQGAPLALQGQHTEGEDDPWTVSIPDHVQRTDSPGFVAAKNLAHKILTTLGLGDQFYGTAVIQMHHGGSLWLFDNSGWFMVQNQAGIEWSAQFCADPKKVEHLRLNAKRLYDAFPATLPEMARLGYKDGDAILNTPISDDKGVARWVDSIFNSCVPLPAVRHIGVLPKGDGRHHYPTPVTDIDLVKYDDFVLWVTDPASGQEAAVVPVAARGKNVNETRLVYATPGTELDNQHATAHQAGKAVQFGASSPLTQQAYKLQQGS